MKMIHTLLQTRGSNRGVPDPDRPRVYRRRRRASMLRWTVDLQPSAHEKLSIASHVEGVS